MIFLDRRFQNTQVLIISFDMIGVYFSISGLFISLGLTGVIPAMHFLFIEGFQCAVYEFAFLHLVLMAVLYIGGALMYAFRVPESVWPGKFDIWVNV